METQFPENAIDQIEQELVDMVVDLYGEELYLENFTETVFSIFEDIAGLETLTEDQAVSLIDKLWRRYRGKKDWH